ncbi:MAG: hypothetical protein JSU63_21005 [Phycisphaerales bacterium]|nr:MAG: hypothetical protein JSU63_21005 [Phycisphaerales bacterium]
MNVGTSLRLRRPLSQRGLWGLLVIIVAFSFSGAVYADKAFSSAEDSKLAGTRAGSRTRSDPAPPGLPSDTEHQAPKNRYISIDPSTNGPTPVALEVSLSSMMRCSDDLSLACESDGDCSGTCIEHPDTGLTWWVGEPFQEPRGCLPPPCGADDSIARMVHQPVFRVWTEETLHVGDCEMVPVATYGIRATPDGETFSAPLSVATIGKPGLAHYGDVVGMSTGHLPPLPGFTPPNGIVNVSDVSAYLLTVDGPFSPSAHVTWIDLHGPGLGSPPQYVLNASDLTRIYFGMQGETYTQQPNQLDPGQCPTDEPAVCGNGLLEPVGGEQCDDGNRAPGDCCGPFCQFEMSCRHRIEWLPVHSTASFAIDGNEITVAPGGATVTLHLMISGWDPDQDGDPLLGSFQATVDSSGYASGSGSALVPVGFGTADPWDGAFQALKICCSNLADPIGTADWLSNCTSDPGVCPPLPAGCIDRPDYIYDGISYMPLMSYATDDYSWGAISTDCAEDPDGGTTKLYGGTLLLEVPPGAAGTYTIGFDTDLDANSLTDCLGDPLNGVGLVPAEITIGGDFEEPCCLPDDSCVADMDPVLCEAVGGTVVCACLGDSQPNGTDDACECPATVPDKVLAEDSLSTSCLGDGDCTNLATCSDSACYVPKNRYISISPGNAGRCMAIRVELTGSLYFPECAGEQWWVGPPDPASGIARLQTEPEYRDWSADPPVIHVGDIQIIPAAAYEVRAIKQNCDTASELNYSLPLAIATVPKPSNGFWADVAGLGTPEEGFIPPDGIVDIVDVRAYVFWFHDDPVAPPLIWLDLARSVPSGTIDGRDQLAVLEARDGGIYPGQGPCSSKSTMSSDAHTHSDADATLHVAADAGRESDGDDRLPSPELECRVVELGDNTTGPELPQYPGTDLYRALPSATVVLEVFLSTEVTALESYQTVIGTERTVGDTGTIDVICGEPVHMCPTIDEEDGVEICEGHETDGGEVDFVYHGVPSDSIEGGTPCPPRLATRTVYSGWDVPPVPPGPPGYLASYALEVSEDTGNTIFEVGLVPDEESQDPKENSGTYLLREPDSSFNPSGSYTVDVPCAKIWVVQDCNSNSIPDDCEVGGDVCDEAGVCDPGDCGISPNCNADAGDLTPDECEGDSDGDGVIDGCDKCPGFDDTDDDDGDTAPDACDLCPGENDRLDADADGVPDGCDICPGYDDNTDTDADGAPNGCDICEGHDDNTDTDEDGAPDGCDLCIGFDDNLDCNNNATADGCDIREADGGLCTGAECSLDCNGNGFPDECDIWGTVDGPTFCGPQCEQCSPQLLGTPCESACVSAGIPDSCSYGMELDRPQAENSLSACCTTDEHCLKAACSRCEDGPDAYNRCTSDTDCRDSVCEEICTGTTAQCLDGGCYVPKNRYVSMVPHTGTQVAAIEVRLTEMWRCGTITDRTCVTDDDCLETSCVNRADPDDPGMIWWVGDPYDAGCFDDEGNPTGRPCLGEYVARLVDTPVYRVWPDKVVNIADCETIPVAKYSIRSIPQGGEFSPSLYLDTIAKPGVNHFGDTVDRGTGRLPPWCGFSPPQGVVNISDIHALLLTVEGAITPNAPVTWIDMVGTTDIAPDFLLNISDLQMLLKGNEGYTWLEAHGQALLPEDCP